MRSKNNSQANIAVNNHQLQSYGGVAHSSVGLPANLMGRNARHLNQTNASQQLLYGGAGVDN